MKSSPCYASHAVHHYLAMQEEAEAAQERLNRQVSDELLKRDTWFDGFNDCVTSERPTNPNPIIDALMAGDDAQVGYLIRRYITEVFAVSQAEDAIQIQDEDAENGFYA